MVDDRWYMGGSRNGTPHKINIKSIYKHQTGIQASDRYTSIRQVYKPQTGIQASDRYTSIYNIQYIQYIHGGRYLSVARRPCAASGVIRPTSHETYFHRAYIYRDLLFPRKFGARRRDLLSSRPTFYEPTFIEWRVCFFMTLGSFWGHLGCI